MFQINLNKTFSLFIIVGSLGACGVKARPLAPTVAPPMSNGVPNYYKKNDVEVVKSKYNSKIEEGSGTESDNAQ